MTVQLRTSRDLPDPASYDNWLAVSTTEVLLAAEKAIPNIAEKLENAFSEIRDDWWSLGRELGQTPSGRLAHTPTCSTFISDFGEHLAWTRLVADAVSANQQTLVVCDDPWAFRHLCQIDGLNSGRKPPLLWLSLAYFMRGWISRGLVSLRMIHAKLKLNNRPNPAAGKGSVLLVYGHPTSTADGYDAYFGTLMRDLSEVTRLIHTDCRPSRAEELTGDNRTFSLHSWGSVLFALSLIFVFWRPKKAHLSGPYGWLIRRAAAIENSAGALSMTRWQIFCQDRWLKATGPFSVTWSWENHPWERAFVRSARKLGVRTVGSQDTDVGRHQWNMSPASNPDGLDSVPDIIICNGPAFADELLAWNIPPDRIEVGGSYRLKRIEDSNFDPEGPVFVALSSIPAISKEMMISVQAARNGRHQFLIKEHPMYPFQFEETEDVLRTSQSIPNCLKISAVFYGTGFSGMEGILFGVPTIRLLPNKRIGIDTLPEMLTPITATVNTFKNILDHPMQVPDVKWDDVFVPVDISVWQRNLLEQPTSKQ